MSKKESKKQVCDMQDEQSNLCKVCQVLKGTFFFVFGIVSLVAYYSYDMLDASFNTASDTDIMNKAGKFGSYAADIYHQYIGRATVFIMIAFIYYGFKLIRVRESNPRRTAALIISFFLLPIFFNDAIYGSLVFSGFFGLLDNNFDAPGMYLLLKLILGSVSVVLYFYGIDFTWGVFQRAYYTNKAMLKIIKEKLHHDDDNIDSSDAVEAPSKEPKIKEPKKEKSKKKEPTLAPSSSKPLTIKKGAELSLDLLASPPKDANVGIGKDILEATARRLEEVMLEFGVRGKIVDYNEGPVVTLYEFEPAPGIKSTRIINLSYDIARAMSAVSVRIAVIPGRTVLGIEMPNPKRKTVFLRTLFEDKAYNDTKNALNIALGQDIGGTPIYADLAKMPHLLVAGTTGSGKSVAINTMLLSLLFRLSPEECKLIMIDPKMLELSIYNDIPHLLTPVVTDPSKAVVALKWAVREMEDRYRAMSQLGVRNIDNFNKKLKEMKDSETPLTRTVQTGFDDDDNPVYEEQTLDLKLLPYIVIIVDEMADLMLVAGKDVEGAIQRLAQMARAAGIHLIMATQRPSVDVITGTIKANFPSRMSFHVSSKIDSQTILGEKGAEQLLGMGDMLFMASGGRPQRIHGPFVSDKEVENIANILRAQGKPSYMSAITEDTGDSMSSSSDGTSDNSLFDQAVDIIRTEGKVSISFIQRKLRIGYNKAATLVEEMEEQGIVSKPNGMGKREVL